MARKKSPTLTEAEHRIMAVIWELGEASVKDVADRLAETKDLAYNTVSTMLKILLDKGYVDYRKEGRAFIYRPLVDRRQARAKAVKHLLNRFFNNSPDLLIQNLLEDEQISTGELEELKQRVLDSFESKEP
jgi:predicted transcriptional regulator